MPSRASFTPADWLAVKQLYDAALALTGTARESFVADAPVTEAVRAEARALLEFEPDRDGDGDATGGFLNEPAAATMLAQHPAEAAGASRIGERLGAWQIVRRLGSGGMGDVFEASRADGSFEGRAAVKLIKRGMDSEAVLQRFAQERQALARLQHPNIATLLDAGLSADGLPYFVMEFVDGVPINEAALNLSVERRLGLFLQLTDAVACAHRNLLVHRDLKPGNVLVTQRGEVKLLDFGIAKALDPVDLINSNSGLGAPVDDTTIGHARPFTPNYASPEQVRGEPVSTATDIYSLGVLLYQLLTGVRPTGRDATTPAQTARSVLEEMPTRPSSLSERITNDPHWLATRKRLAGDLDNVLLKALEKPVARRYASVDALAADMRAYLSGHPVSARAATWRYVAGKFIARNRVPMLAAGAAAFALVAGATAALWQAHEARLASAEARLARDEARGQLAGIKQVTRELVFRFGDAINALPGGFAAQEVLLKQTIATLEQALRSAPGDADLAAITGAAMGRLAQVQGNPSMAGADRIKEAEATVARALALGEPIWARKRGDWQFAQWHVITLITRSQLMTVQGRLADGLPALALAVSRATEALAEPLPAEGRAYLLEARAVALVNTATTHHHITRPSLHRPAEALRMLELAELDVRKLRGDKSLLDAMDRGAVPGEPAAVEFATDSLSHVMSSRAMCRDQLDDPEGMARDARQALELANVNLAAGASNVLWRQNAMQVGDVLATALNRLAHHAEALQASRAAHELSASLLKSEGKSRKWTDAQAALGPQLGRALAGLGRHAEAVTVFDQALAAASARVTTGDAADADAQRRASSMRTQLSRSQQALGQVAAAAVSAREAATGLQAAAILGPETREVWIDLGEALAWQGQLQPALAAELRERARAAYDRAGALNPLKAEHAAARAALV